MQDDDIFKMAFITALIGMVGIIIFSSYIVPREVKIKDIDKGMLDEEVTLEGFVSKMQKSKNTNTYFLEITDDTGKISGIIFEKTVIEIEKGNLKINSLKNRRIKIIGTVTQYRGDMEIVLKDAKSIKILA